MVGEEFFGSSSRDIKMRKTIRANTKEHDYR